MTVACIQCDLQLTNHLTVIQNVSELQETDGEDFIRPGYFFVSDGVFYRGSDHAIIINTKDLINSKNHPDSGRLNGCCGFDGLDGLNKVCSNGHEIATEKSDCWLPHAVIFERDKIKMIH
jgi:hypothetical protein